MKISFFSRKKEEKKNERRNHCSQKKFKLTPLHAYGKYYITKCKGKRKITYNGRKRNGVRIRVRAPCRFSSSSGRDLGVSTFSSDPREAFVSNETSSLVRRRSRFCIPKHCEVTWHYAADLTSERVRSEFVNIVCRPFRFARILSVSLPPSSSSSSPSNFPILYLRLCLKRDFDHTRYCYPFVWNANENILW